jgi:hypothetical protein
MIVMVMDVNDSTTRCVVLVEAERLTNLRAIATYALISKSWLNLRGLIGLMHRIRLSGWHDFALQDWLALRR